MNEFIGIRKQIVYILAATGYDEDWLNQFIFQADVRGWLTSIIGLTQRPILGNLGNALKVTYTLSQITDFPPDLLVIPAGENCLRQLFVDPHVHGFIKTTVDHNGRVAVSPIGEIYMRRARIPVPLNQGRVLFQRHATVADFANHIGSA